MKCEHCGMRLGVPYYYVRTLCSSEYWCEDCLESIDRRYGISHVFGESVSVELVTEDDEMEDEQYD